MPGCSTAQCFCRQGREHRAVSATCTLSRRPQPKGNSTHSYSLTSHVFQAAVRLTQLDVPPIESDPILVCTAFKSGRFFIFSRREPEETEGAMHGRDIFNEPLTREQILAAEAEIMTSVNLPASATLHTTKAPASHQLHHHCVVSRETFKSSCFQMNAPER